MNRAIHSLSHLRRVLLPFLDWLPNCRAKQVQADLLAGITVAVINIPQMMALATLAGLPPVYGLYTAIAGGAIASLWGSSQLLSTGPVAIVSLLVFAALAPLATPGSNEYITLAIALAFCVGLVQLTIGFARLGKLVHFIPHSATAGFVFAGSIIIGLTQLPTLLGFKVASGHYIIETIATMATSLDQTHLLTAAIGIVSVGLLVGVKRIMPTFPTALVLVLVSIWASWFFDLAGMGVPIVGEIPNTLPSLALPELTLAQLLFFLPQAALIATVGFTEAYTIASALARERGNKIDINQEFVGQGFGNIASGLFSGYPISGSFSRTAVNVQAGAQTALAGVFAAITVAVSLVFFSQYLSYLPQTIMAATIIYSITGLINVKRLDYLSHLVPTDGLVAMTTVILSLVFKPDIGLIAGIVLALCLLLYKMTKPQIFAMAPDASTTALRPTHFEDFEADPEYDGQNTVIISPNMSIFYANADQVFRHMKRRMVEHERAMGVPTTTVILDFSGVVMVDLSAIEELEYFLEELERRDQKLGIIYMRRSVQGSLYRAGLLDKIHVFQNIRDIKRYIEERKSEG